MDFLKQNGGYLMIGLLVAAVVYGGYSYFGGRSAPEAPLTVRSSALGGSSGVGADLLATLLSLNSLVLDPAIFGDPVFRSLKDFGLPIPEEPMGRANPFAPLGERSAPPPASSSATP